MSLVCIKRETEGKWNKHKWKESQRDLEGMGLYIILENEEDIVRMLSQFLLNHRLVLQKFWGQERECLVWNYIQTLHWNCNLRGGTRETQTRCQHPVRPVQCCIRPAVQQRSRRRRRRWAAGRGSCTLEDQWDAWTCPASSESPGSHLGESKGVNMDLLEHKTRFTDCFTKCFTEQKE